MIRKHASLILAATAFASASALAGGAAVSSSSGASVGSGTGLIVSQGAPSSTVIVTPANTVVVAPGTRVYPGAAQVQASQTRVMGGPAPGVTSTTTVTTNYWVNVPAGVERRGDFQRWRALK